MLASHDENPIDDDELLTGTGSGGVFTSGYLKERPLIEYLAESERVAFLLSNGKKGVREESDEGGTAYTPGDGYQAIAAVTDTRVMFVVGDCNETDGDAMFAVPYTEIEDVKTDRGVLTKRLDVWTTSGTCWRFYVKSSVDLQPAADYLDLAAVVWSRVENQLGRAEDHVIDVTAETEDRSFEAAVEAGTKARELVDEARRMATELTENRQDAIWERILAVEERLDSARLATHREWGQYHEHEAERQWRKELYNQAYESYEAARDAYRAALDIAREQGLDAADDLVDEIDDVRHDIDRLSKSPLRRAEETRDRAAALDDPALAARAWEEALERYQTTLVLDWGTDDQRFAGDSEAIRAEIECIVDRIDETRREVAREHEEAADEYFDAADYERARREYGLARDELERALSVAAELRPSLVDDLEDRMAALDDRMTTAKERADAGGFEFVGDVREDDGVLARLVGAEPAAFVDVVAETWAAMGWTTTAVSDERDGPVDVIAEKSHPVPETRLLVAEQAPTTTTLGADAVTGVASTVDEECDADMVTFVTTGAFTDAAREAAAGTNLKLIDGDRLADILEAEDMADFDPVDRKRAAD